MCFFQSSVSHDVLELRLPPSNPTQHKSCWRTWGCPILAWGSWEVNLPRDPVPGRSSHLNVLGDPPAWGPRRLTCLGIWSPGGCHASTCSGIHQSRGPRKLICLDIWSPGGCHASIYSVIRQSMDLRRSTCLDLSRDPILWKATCLNLHRIQSLGGCHTSDCLGNLHLDPGTPSSQVQQYSVG